jgi:fused signal recognition particle receptor
MVFNWFRRQFDENTDQPAEQPVEEKIEDIAPPVEEVEETASESPALQEDYLQWAKQAYQNLQKQQHHEEPSTQVEAEPEKEVELAEPLVTTVLETVESVKHIVTMVETHPVASAEVESTTEVAEQVTVIKESTETIEPVVAEATTMENTDTAVLEIAHDQPELTTVSNIETAETTPESDMPFWMKAQAERLARLDKLKETAIEEEVVEETTVTNTSDEDLELPDIDFDEGFLWSAEILRSQGRRPDQVSVEEITWLQKLRRGLDRTRRNLLNQLKAIVGQGPLNQSAVMEIEAMLLQADVGVEATDYIINSLQEKLKTDVLPPEQAIAYLKGILREILDKPCQREDDQPFYSFTFAPEKDQLNIWIVTGVNGAGKTTTIGKLAHLAQKSGYRCLIAAADTFRAAAVEQVKVWGDRSGVEIIANPGKNTDPAAVVFDAISAAESRNTELLIVDTAGRLQNKKNLMEELSKIRRIIDKKAPNAKVESLLVLDSTLGQNGLRQAEIFAQSAQLSGVILTKLDGTAKGGVALAVVKELGLPIRFIGVGESIGDLRPFSSYEFVEALLNG